MSLRVPRELRGVELDADTLDDLGARLQAYHISPVAHRPEISAPDPAMPETRTLISFLGTSNYQRTRYCWLERRGGEDVETPYVAAALAHMTRPAQIVLLATPAAQEKHGTALRGELERLAPGCPMRFEPIDEGKTPQELWKIFTLLERGMSSGGEILLDITLGFRSLPLFASAVVAYRRVIAPQAAPVTVCYGAYEAIDAEGRAPIWDLTAVVELADWSAAIGGFLKTGHAEPLVQALDALANRLDRLWATGGKRGPRPRVRQFAKALRDFANDLATVRVASLIVGRDRGSAEQAKFDTPSAQALLRALDEAEGDIVNHIPPLAPVLEQMRKRIAPLCKGTLEGDAGERALAELTHLYLQLARYSEAAIVLREAWTSRYAPPEARVP